LFPHYAEPVARAATPAIAALLAAQVPHQVLQYHHDPRNESFGEEAMQELAQVEGVRPEQVFKTLVIALPKGLAVAVIPVPSKLSLKAGYIIGGISPFGQRKQLPTVVDASALRWDRVLCSAGKRGWDVGVHPQDLIRLTNAVTADIRAT
jgi:Cys-tRNA(Pro)/Cys-tRNA(Cys) deacylase